MKKVIMVLIVLFGLTLLGTKLIAPDCAKNLASYNRMCALNFDICYTSCYNRFNKGEKRYYCKERCQLKKQVCTDAAVSVFLDCIGD